MRAAKMKALIQWGASMAIGAAMMASGQTHGYTLSLVLTRPLEGHAGTRPSPPPSREAEVAAAEALAAVGHRAGGGSLPNAYTSPQT
ncbi:hypothetical protein E2562_012363 [Oryza meyeriana var. granulata]|uniref:Uncharacterized protein n=1 Tax=Oryza meyeriana var. granulata TaxID=110450 RepID=A0A6G1DI65_9ORYZ|nr:hypothetical protein E2562_012363 [Oryza meyeriana var. granulata]